ncbi:MAG: CocE/NonD family hydrolase [Acidobacteria bacterium]|nr:CocE/NonD family hydrolase [Acidobacteriota bacterium]
MHQWLHRSAALIAAVLLSAGSVTAQDGVQTGVFFGVEGLNFRTPTLSGTTNAQGEYKYRPGETVTFSVGELPLGSAAGGKELMTVAHLILGVNGDVEKIHFPQATNAARFLQSLDADGNVENGVAISDKARELASTYEHDIEFGNSEEEFAAQPGVKAIITALGTRLRTPAEARNHLRYALWGIQKFTDVKIPTRDGAYVLGDVFRPIAPGKYPAIVGIGSYGKAFYRGCTCNDQEVQEKAIAQDRFFMGNPERHPYENHETADARYWVPRGYAVVRIDGRGVCNTPGLMNPYSAQEAEDFYDSIEWIASRDWANGNVGTWGASYFGINQPIVASLQPPSLKAMVVSAGDSERFRQVLFTGGISNVIGREGWWEKSVKVNRCLGQPTFDRVAHQNANPFADPPAWGTYYNNPKPPGEIDADMSKVTVPMLVEVPLSHTGHQHIRGSTVTYMDAASKEKQLSFITGDFISGWMYTPPALEHHLKFYDRFLKGKPQSTDVMKPAVRMMIRSGDRGWFWQYENEFPVARTDYRKFYLHGTPASVAGANRTDFLTLGRSEPKQAASKSYAADVDRQTVACSAHGISFISEPMTEDVTLAGYAKLVAWVSSTSPDMDLFASVRVLDENGKEVQYALAPERRDYPVGKGGLKVSHRALDPKKSTPFLPFHTHSKADYAPLKGKNDIVRVEVEIEPTTALVRAGHRVRLDLQPIGGCGWGTPFVYDTSYHDGASNTIHMGPQRASYLQLPVIPAKPVMTSQR